MEIYHIVMVDCALGKEVNDKKKKLSGLAESLLVAQFNQIRQICGEDMDFRATNCYLTGLGAAEGLQEGVDFHI